MDYEEAKNVIREAPVEIEKFKFNLCSMMTLNQVARSHYYVTAKHKKDNTLIAYLDCQGKRKFKGKVWLELYYFLKKNIDPIDNLPSAMKPIFDGMVEAEIIKDDSIDVIQSPSINWYVIMPKERKCENFVIVLISEKPIFKGQFIKV